MEKKYTRKKTNSSKKKIYKGKFEAQVSRSDTPPEMPTTNQEENTEQNIEGFWGNHLRVNLPTYVLGFLTFCLVGVSLWQAWENKKASDDELRAYVAVHTIDTLHYKKTFEMAKISIVNDGKTPARRVTIEYIFEYLARDTLAHLDSVFFPSPAVKNEYSLAPGETYILPVRPTRAGQKDSSLWWNPDTIHNARHLYGRIVYYDNRDVRHRTIFAFQWEYLTMSYRRVGGMNYFDCDQPDPHGKKYPFN